MKHPLIVENLGGFGHLERFYADFNRLLSNPRIEEAKFDLSPITFMTPETVLALVCTARCWYESRQTLVKLVSVDERVHQYLQRINLFAECASYLTIDQDEPTEPWSRSTSANLLEITTISSDLETNAQSVYAVFQKASSLLLGRVDNLRMKAACDLLTVVVENITHSQDMGHVLMQSYQVADGYRVHIGIADLGLGIPATLKPRYPDIGSDSAYLLKALEMGVTSRKGMGGLGLFNMNRIVQGQHGSLTIRADRSMLQLLGNRVYLRDDLTPMPGTQVYITVWGNHDTSLWEYLLPVHLT